MSFTTNQTFIKRLKQFNPEKMPLCLLYGELVAEYKTMNGWTCQEWIDYINELSQGKNFRELTNILKENEGKIFQIYCPKVWDYDKKKLVNSATNLVRYFELKFENDKLFTRSLKKDSNWEETSLCKFGKYFIK